MVQACDACQLTERGYTVYFINTRDAALLAHYFYKFPKEDFFSLDENSLWMTEAVFFDVMDYLLAHIDEEKVFAAVTKQTHPVLPLEHMKPIQHFLAEREASWIDDIIKRKAICTHYQPIVAAAESGVNIIGYELLARGLDKNGTIIPPFKLFQAAKVRNRLFTLDRLCRMENIRNASSIREQLLFINFIPTSIYVPEHCLSTTFQLIDALHIKPEQLVFEVVETEKVEDLQHLKRILHYYREHGFRYALDDVGTGYNSVQTLSELRPDFVKLAFEYTNGVSSAVHKQTVARSVASIAHEMGAQVLAEGVETREDFEWLQNAGYDLFQGYYFAKPHSTPVTDLSI